MQTPTSRSRPKTTSADSRVQISHIFRLMAANMQPGTLRNNRLIRARFIDFINDSLRFVLSATSGECCPPFLNSSVHAGEERGGGGGSLKGLLRLIMGNILR